MCKESDAIDIQTLAFASVFCYAFYMQSLNTIVLDIGTSSIKAFIFDSSFNIVAQTHKPLKRFFPKRGWVEQDPRELLSVSKNALREITKKSHLNQNSFSGLGITNQRETTICWDKKTGNPIYPAIVWEDTRTRRISSKLKKVFGKKIRAKTGLTTDPYFSATKIHWILKNIDSAKQLVDSGRLAFGTVDSWILWNLLEGQPHITDYTNASRTLLFNIVNLKWDKELLKIFEIPASILPRAMPSRASFGNLKKDILGFSLPINAVCGDQQASLFAAGTTKGVTKVTYGTGTFVMQSQGSSFGLNKNFFTTLVPGRKKPLYALEAKVARSGKAIEKVLHQPKKLKSLFVRLSKKVDKFLDKLPHKPKEIVVDGGATQAKLLLQLQAATSKLTVKKQRIFDGTALGVAMLTKMKR